MPGTQMIAESCRTGSIMFSPAAWGSQTPSNSFSGLDKEGRKRTERGRLLVSSQPLNKALRAAHSLWRSPISFSAAAPAFSPWQVDIIISFWTVKLPKEKNFTLKPSVLLLMLLLGLKLSSKVIFKKQLYKKYKNSFKWRFYATDSVPYLNDFFWAWIAFLLPTIQ